MPTYDEHVALADLAVRRLLGGEPVVYAPEVGEPVEVVGVFDAEYVLAKGAANAGVETLGPAVFLKLADLPVDPENDDPTLTIRGVDYRVVDRRFAGMGSIVLALRLVT